MTAREIENVATGVGLSGERLRELFEVEFYKRMNGTFGKTEKGNGEMWNAYRICEPEDNGDTNCNGSTHDNKQPIEDDGEPQNNALPLKPIE